MLSMSQLFQPTEQLPSTPKNSTNILETFHTMTLPELKDKLSALAIQEVKDPKFYQTLYTKLLSSAFYKDIFNVSIPDPELLKIQKSFEKNGIHLHYRINLTRSPEPKCPRLVFN